MIVDRRTRTPENPPGRCVSSDLVSCDLQVREPVGAGERLGVASDCVAWWSCAAGLWVCLGLDGGCGVIVSFVCGIRGIVTV